LDNAAFFNSLVNYEKTPGYAYDLDAYRKFLEKLGSPHKKLRNVILIAGTKGKGSTAAIISSCLKAHGYKVGSYSSPHLERINERIKINDREITDHELARYSRIIKPHVNFKTRIGARTFFEVLTAIAFLHFVRKDADFSVLEVGLGGRLDATNVTDPLISVITRIGYDHMNMLGNTLVQIAREKAGIIKKFSPSPLSSPLRGEETVRGGKTVITIRQRPVVERILKKTAEQRGYEMIFAEALHKAVTEKMCLDGTRVKVTGELGSFRAFLPLAGKHQIENMLIALAVLSDLKKNRYNIDSRKVKNGIESTVLHGRFEVLLRRPPVIYDVAHSEDSFRALEKNIKEIFWNRTLRLVKNGTEVPTPKRGLYLILGCSKDKDISYAVKHILPLADEVLLVKAEHPRAMEPLDIFTRAGKYQKHIKIAGSVRRAFEYLRTREDMRTPIIVFGSFYLWNEARKSIFRR
jgi:dihydrofolate synthase/folylpolyglutamate synthase